MNITHK